MNPNLNMPQFPVQTPNLNLQSTSKSSPPIQTPPEQTQTVQEELPPPKFYIYNEETKLIEKSEKVLEKKYDDLFSGSWNRNHHSVH